MIYLVLTALFVSLLARKVQHGPTPTNESEGDPPSRGFKWPSLRGGRQTKE
jgi:hypothetical protein